MRWKLNQEEISSELIYVKCSNNMVEDALGRLDKVYNINE